MATSRDYIPTKDEDLQAFGANFSTLISATPTTYGLTAGDATSVATAQTAFTTALTIATNPATRTVVTVQTKDSARATLVDLIRAKAAIVQAFAGITPTLLANLGLTVRKTTKTPVPVPATRPLLSVIKSNGPAVDIRLSDELTPDKRAFPAGSVICQVFMKTGAVPPVNVSECSLLAATGRSVNTLDISTVPVGTVMHFLARWQNRKGQTGPASTVATQYRTA